MSVDKYFQEGEYLPSIIKNITTDPTRLNFLQSSIIVSLAIKPLLLKHPPDMGKHCLTSFPYLSLEEKQ